MSLAIWADKTGEKILIGDEDCKEGDPVFIVLLTPENVLAWIKALSLVLEDGDIQDLPGEVGMCSDVW